MDNILCEHIVKKFRRFNGGGLNPSTLFLSGYATGVVYTVGWIAVCRC